MRITEDDTCLLGHAGLGMMTCWRMSRMLNHKRMSATLQ